MNTFNDTIASLAAKDKDAASLRGGRSVPMGPALISRGGGVDLAEREGPVDRRRPLEIACDAQDPAKMRLADIITEIESRVAAVQRPPRAEQAIESVPMPPPIGMSPAVRYVEDTTRFIDGCTARLRAVLDSLEI